MPHEARAAPTPPMGFPANPRNPSGCSRPLACQMIGEHPIKQILLDAQPHWDREGTPPHVREELLKVIKCRTVALGAQIYASETESKLVFHTCKSRFCTSCGQRATQAWQEDLEATLPEVPYIGHNVDNADGVPDDSSAKQTPPSRPPSHGGGSNNTVGEGSVWGALARPCCPADIRRISQLRSPSPRYGFSRRFAGLDKSLDPSSQIR